LVADIDSVRTVREAQAMDVRAVAPVSAHALVAAGEGRAFRAAWGQAGDGLVSPETAARLRIAPGDRLFVAA
jgi:arginine/ornithine N-succinyltransferase beta subunit